MGGVVRDKYILNIECHDIDLATKLLPNDIIRIAKQNHLPSIPTGIEHGTITILNGDQAIEITTLRIDTTTDGRHAQVEFTDSWYLDASRRDLTFNALYMDENNKIYDYFNGVSDLKKGIVRFIGNADERIHEDALRILRFFRFYIKYGQTMDQESYNACIRNQNLIFNLSHERITQEIMKMIISDDCIKLTTILINEIFKNIISVNISHDLTMSNDIAIRFKLLNIERKYLKLSNKFLRYQKLIDPFHENDISLVRRFYIENDLKTFQDKILITKIINNIDIQQPKSVFAFPMTGHDCIKYNLHGKQIHNAIEYMKYWWYSHDEKKSLNQCYDELQRWKLQNEE